MGMGTPLITRTELPSQNSEVSSHILLSWGRSFAKETAGAAPTSFAVNSTYVPLLRKIVLVLRFPMGVAEGTGFELEGWRVGFGSAMLW
jgi:hypothetical protein